MSARLGGRGRLAVVAVAAAVAVVAVLFAGGGNLANAAPEAPARAFI
jgi:hypothetical protein